MPRGFHSGLNLTIKSFRDVSFDGGVLQALSHLITITALYFPPGGSSYNILMDPKGHLKTFQSVKDPI